jgi:hypothetical protein
MALLGTTKWNEYEVTLQEGEELNTWYLLAPSSEEAAWSEDNEDEEEDD